MKRILLALFLLLMCNRAEAATRTIADGGGNWSSNGTWVEGAAPTSSDAVVATATSGNVTIDTTSCVCSTLVLTNYVGTMTFGSGNKLTVTTTVTFVSGMTIAGTGILQISNSGTITSAGKTFTGSIVFDGGSFTLADNWTVSGSVTSLTSANILTGNTLYVGGSLAAIAAVSGTTEIVLNGTGILSTSTGVSIKNNLTINTTGTITVGSTLYYGTGVLTYTAGTVVTSSSALWIVTSCTLNTNGITWNNFYIFDNLLTVTLGSDLNISGTLSIRGYNLTFSGSYDISCGIFITYTETASAPVTFNAGTTLTVTSALQLNANSAHTITFSSSTPSSPVYFVYQGTQADCSINKIIFTDIDASGSAITLYNWHGGTLTRTSGIINVTGDDIGGGTQDDIFGAII